MDLSWNSFGIRGARLLSAGMKQATGVEELYLAWTGVGDEGASHLAQVSNVCGGGGGRIVAGD